MRSYGRLIGDITEDLTREWIVGKPFSVRKFHASDFHAGDFKGSVWLTRRAPLSGTGEASGRFTR